MKFQIDNKDDIYKLIKSNHNLKTKDNITIKLPKEGAEQALIKVQNIFNNIELKDNNVIDLRIPNQVILINE